LRVNAGFYSKILLLLLLVPAVLIQVTAGQNASFSPAAWEQHDGYRIRHLEVPSQGKSGFELIDPKTSGVLFTNTLSTEALENDSTLLSGSGVALGDIDGDELCDIYLCSLTGENKLFRNLGQWRFQDITEQAGVRCPGQISRGAVFADVNGDGALDLLVTAKKGGARLFLNDGKGKFSEATSQWGLATNTGSTSMALADLNGDGTLDLYVANFGAEMVLREGGRVSIRMVNGKPMVTGRLSKKIRLINGQLVEFGEPDVLYLNDDASAFKAVPWTEGAFVEANGKPVEIPWDFGLAVQIRDLNGDGLPDIYVCNDFYTPDRIWINCGRGHFRAIDDLAIRKSSFAAMGVDFADINRDGHLDAFIIEMLAMDPVMRLQQKRVDFDALPHALGDRYRPQTARNTLLLNRGDGTFSEIAQFAGLEASDWSWSPVFLDVDLDGFEDLLIANGPTYDLLNLDIIMHHKGRDARLSQSREMDFPKLQTPNRAFRNQRDLTFKECGAEWHFNSLSASTAMALADLDGDGDLDVVMNCLGSNALLYRNESAQPRVAVRLKGSPPNTQGIGALVSLRGGAVPFQSQEIVSGGRYLSGDDPVRVFAAGSLTNRMSIEVAWRSGKHSLISNVLPNCLYEIQESVAKSPEDFPPAGAQAIKPWFEDLSALLGHRDIKEAFDDFERQPLLPWHLAHPGPGVAWCDLFGDGTEELVIGGSPNSPLSVFRWDGRNRFEPVSAPKESLQANSTGMACAFSGAKPALLIAQSNYEQPHDAVSSVMALMAQTNAPSQTRLEVVVSNLGPESVDPVAVGDFTGTGELEMFVGGRVIPGRYPEAASSYILRNHNGSWAQDTNLSLAFRSIGLVTGAVFSDLDGDGRPELVLACEWGPIRVFRNAGDRLVELTAELGLSRFTGLWQSITTGDFDGDGKMDILAGNWGLNSEHKASEKQPLVLYYGDFAGDGSIQILETQYDLTGQKLLPLRSWESLTEAMPHLVRRCPNHKSFSEAGIEGILGERLPHARKLEARTLASMLFLNRGDHFEARSLPSPAQFAPVFGMAVADFDGDGFEDVLLAQNFFGTRTESLRLDGGQGLLLKGNGRGDFTAVPGQESGIRIYGEPRGCAVADYDGDGRVDAVVCQRGGDTRLLHNVRAEPGLLIRLKGPDSNPAGLGANVRLGLDGNWGPAREIHSGAGYFSQDSTRIVMAARSAREILVRWPGGKLVSSPLPQGAKEIAVRWTGEVEVLR
jgi:hypothetical protein